MAIDTLPETLTPDFERIINLGDRSGITSFSALAKASKQAVDRKYQDFLIVDADAHHNENEAWSDIFKYIEDPVVRHRAFHGLRSGRGLGAISGSPPTNQNVAGRIEQGSQRRHERATVDEPKEANIILRSMDAIGIDYQVLFPTPLLQLGLHQDSDIEVGLSWAYSRWLTEEVLPHNDRIKTMVYLPFNNPEACVRVIEQFADKPGVVGFEVTSARFRPVHHNVYMRIYRMLEERDMPLAFHAIFNQSDRLFADMNKFISVHSLGFVLHNLVHIINMVVNGIPERFPNLKVVWIENGLAWLPFMMQRLDNEYMMRTSECPQLKKLPSEYMADFFYTTQPMETHYRKALEVTFEMMHAESQLLFASDYPHWDFNLPNTIYDLPFISEQAKRNILGENARKLFKLTGEKRAPRL